MDRNILAQIPILYWEEKKTIREVALQLNIGTSTVNRYLPQKRTFKEAQVLYLSTHPPKSTRPRQQLKSGYVKLYDPLKVVSNKYEYEHRVIWEEYHQKKLPAGWVVHHLNGIRNDNRPENLVAMPRGKHDKIIPEMAKRIRQLEIESRQLRKVLEDHQAIFYLPENEN